jgi:hypothetical protein
MDGTIYYSIERRDTMREQNKREHRDFIPLNGRLVATPNDGPLIGAKTNIDPENVEEFNPYRKENLPKGTEEKSE